MKNNLVVMVIIIVIVGAGAFFAGMKYQQSKQPSRANFQTRQGTQGIQRPPGANMVRGEIIGKDETSMTVKLPDESSKIILFSENTQVNKATEGSVDDLETGQQVMVFGQTNSDGSITAQNIQLNPVFRERFQEELE